MTTHDHPMPTWGQHFLEVLGELSKIDPSVNPTDLQRLGMAEIVEHLNAGMNKEQRAEHGHIQREQGSHQAMFYLHANVPNYNEIMWKGVDAFKAAYLAKHQS